MIGTEIGFNAKEISKMWQALSKLALHVRLPEHKDDRIDSYGDKDKTRKKVEQAVVELERLSMTTMSFSGLGPVVSFQCDCGETNRRRAELLKQGQSVSCIVPNCLASWKVEKKDDETFFALEGLSVPCGTCGAKSQFHLRDVLRMKKNEVGKFICRSCDEKNLMAWRLMTTPSPESALKKSEPD